MNSIKRSPVFKIISFILIVTSITFDIAYAYPQDGAVSAPAKSATLATPSMLAQLAQAREAFPNSIFNSISVRTALASFGRIVLTGSPAHGIQQMSPAELPGIATEQLKRAGLDTLCLPGNPASIMTKKQTGCIIDHIKAIAWEGANIRILNNEEKVDQNTAIILVPVVKNGDMVVIQIARKDTAAASQLIGFNYFLADTFVMKVVTHDYDGTLDFTESMLKTVKETTPKPEGLTPTPEHMVDEALPLTINTKEEAAPAASETSEEADAQSTGSLNPVAWDGLPSVYYKRIAWTVLLVAGLALTQYLSGLLTPLMHTAEMQGVHHEMAFSPWLLPVAISVIHRHHEREEKRERKERKNKGPEEHIARPYTLDTYSFPSKRIREDRQTQIWTQLFAMPPERAIKMLRQNCAGLDPNTNHRSLLRRITSPNEQQQRALLHRIVRDLSPDEKPYLSPSIVDDVTQSLYDRFATNSSFDAVWTLFLLARFYGEKAKTRHTKDEAFDIFSKAPMGHRIMYVWTNTSMSTGTKREILDMLELYDPDNIALQALRDKTVSREKVDSVALKVESFRAIVRTILNEGVALTAITEKEIALREAIRRSSTDDAAENVRLFYDLLTYRPNRRWFSWIHKERLNQIAALCDIVCQEGYAKLLPDAKASLVNYLPSDNPYRQLLSAGKNVPDRKGKGVRRPVSSKTLLMLIAAAAMLFPGIAGAQDLAAQTAPTMGRGTYFGMLLSITVAPLAFYLLRNSLIRKRALSGLKLHLSIANSNEHSRWYDNTVKEILLRDGVILTESAQGAQLTCNVTIDENGNVLILFTDDSIVRTTGGYLPDLRAELLKRAVKLQKVQPNTLNAIRWADVVFSICGIIASFILLNTLASTMMSAEQIQPIYFWNMFSAIWAWLALCLACYFSPWVDSDEIDRKFDSLPKNILIGALKLILPLPRLVLRDILATTHRSASMSSVDNYTKPTSTAPRKPRNFSLLALISAGLAMLAASSSAWAASSVTFWDLTKTPIVCEITILSIVSIFLYSLKSIIGWYLDSKSAIDYLSYGYEETLYKITRHAKKLRSIFLIRPLLSTSYMLILNHSPIHAIHEALFAIAQHHSWIAVRSLLLPTPVMMDEWPRKKDYFAIVATELAVLDTINVALLPRQTRLRLICFILDFEDYIADTTSAKNTRDVAAMEATAKRILTKLYTPDTYESIKFFIDTSLQSARSARARKKLTDIFTMLDSVRPSVASADHTTFFERVWDLLTRPITLRLALIGAGLAALLVSGGAWADTADQAAPTFIDVVICFFLPTIAGIGILNLLIIRPLKLILWHIDTRESLHTASDDSIEKVYAITRTAGKWHSRFFLRPLLNEVDKYYDRDSKIYHALHEALVAIVRRHPKLAVYMLAVPPARFDQGMASEYFRRVNTNMALLETIDAASLNSLPLRTRAWLIGRLLDIIRTCAPYERTESIEKAALNILTELYEPDTAQYVEFLVREGAARRFSSYSDDSEHSALLAALSHLRINRPSVASADHTTFFERVMGLLQTPIRFNLVLIGAGLATFLAMDSAWAEKTIMAHQKYAPLSIVIAIGAAIVYTAIKYAAARSYFLSRHREIARIVTRLHDFDMPEGTVIMALRNFIDMHTVPPFSNHLIAPFMDVIKQTSDRNTDGAHSISKALAKIAQRYPDSVVRSICARLNAMQTALNDTESTAYRYILNNIDISSLSKKTVETLINSLINYLAETTIDISDPSLPDYLRLLAKLYTIDTKDTYEKVFRMNRKHKSGPKHNNILSIENHVRNACPSVTTMESASFTGTLLPFGLLSQQRTVFTTAGRTFPVIARYAKIALLLTRQDDFAVIQRNDIVNALDEIIRNDKLNSRFSYLLIEPLAFAIQSFKGDGDILSNEIAALKIISKRYPDAVVQSLSRCLYTTKPDASDKALENRALAYLSVLDEINLSSISGASQKALIESLSDYLGWTIEVYTHNSVAEYTPVVNACRELLIKLYNPSTGNLVQEALKRAATNRKPAKKRIREILDELAGKKPSVTNLGTTHRAPFAEKYPQLWKRRKALFGFGAITLLALGALIEQGGSTLIPNSAMVLGVSLIYLGIGGIFAPSHLDRGFGCLTGVAFTAFGFMFLFDNGFDTPYSQYGILYRFTLITVPAIIYRIAEYGIYYTSRIREYLAKIWKAKKRAEVLKAPMQPEAPQNPEPAPETNPTAPIPVPADAAATRAKVKAIFDAVREGATTRKGQAVEAANTVLSNIDAALPGYEIALKHKQLSPGMSAPEIVARAYGILEETRGLTILPDNTTTAYNTLCDLIDTIEADSIVESIVSKAYLAKISRGPDTHGKSDAVIIGIDLGFLSPSDGSTGFITTSNIITPITRGLRELETKMRKEGLDNVRILIPNAQQDLIGMVSEEIERTHAEIGNVFMLGGLEYFRRNENRIPKKDGASPALACISEAALRAALKDLMCDATEAPDIQILPLLSLGLYQAQNPASLTLTSAGVISINYVTIAGKKCPLYGPVVGKAKINELPKINRGRIEPLFAA